MNDYDIVIPCGAKDYIKLPFCIDLCRKFLIPQPLNIYTVSPDKLRIPGTVSILDKEAISVALGEINYRRPNWIYQQLIKLMQNFTISENYLCVDSDLFFNKPIHLFKNNKTNLFSHSIESMQQHHEPYFTFMKMAFNLEKQVNHSFITDFMILNKKICHEIIPNQDEFVDLLNKCISEDCLLSEYEVYGNYVMKNYPKKFNIQNIRGLMSGFYLGNGHAFTSDEVDQFIKRHESQDYQTLALHTWT